MPRQFIQSTKPINLDTDVFFKRKESAYIRVDSTYFVLNDAQTPLFSVTSATPRAAYSVRKLYSTYNGNCVRLRRSSDNAELDFSFFRTGWVDTVAINSWLNGATGFVNTWYDQSGNGYNVTQSTTSLQPRWVNNGDSDSNLKPYLYIGEAASRRLTNSSVNPNGLSNAILNAVGCPVGSQTSNTNNADAAIIFWAETGGWGIVGFSLLAGEIAWRYGTGQSSNVNSKTRTAKNTLQSAAVIKRSGSEFAWVNGVQLGATNTGKITPTAATGTTLQIGFGEQGTVPNTKLCEAVFFIDAPTDAESFISSNQMATFGITS